MEARKDKKNQTARRVLTKSNNPVKFEDPETAPLDFLPPEIITMLENTAYRFSQSEQILLTLISQIIVEILIKEES